MIIYDGPSQLDGSRILGIITGILNDSVNSKTGPMAQLYIISAEEAPVAALRSGSDFSICGDCKHRPENMGSCYVNVARAPEGIFKAWQRGTYPYADAELANLELKEHGKNLRLGAYGDPAALPLYILEDLTKGLRYTGYTHQWKTCRPEYKRYTMASVDTPDEFRLAKEMGWRTFRVRVDGEGLMEREIACPASEEMGFRTTCDRCVLCMGTSIKAKDIAIVVHGAHTKKFVSLRRNDGSIVRPEFNV